MNLYFRLFWMLLRSILRRGTVSLTEPFRRSFRVWPSDCDFNLHLTNARYFSLLDLARIEHLARMKLLGKLLRRRWLPVLNAAEITFIRPLSPWRKFDISTRIITWDEKYFYLEQRFETATTLHAVSLARATFLCRGEVVAPARVAAVAGHEAFRPPRPDIVASWQALLGQKKVHYGGRHAQPSPKPQAYR